MSSSQNENEDVLSNPENPVNPDSKPQLKAGEFTLKPVGEKTRGIASLRGKIVPTIGKFTGIMGGRIQFAPTIIREIL